MPVYYRAARAGMHSRDSIFTAVRISLAAAPTLGITFPRNPLGEHLPLTTGV
jgi:hypothetical protein